ncbi:mersacidin/lichenicidin family type 2 lantibiotic [Sorangium sp. So ce385]|uniref:mersacidin/lichenicidin family type 2 lantibiotic n=1 Tax=Sorangium sp. So ce385 TaxID=3133308 RepID=UPI003F5C6055
MSKSLTIRAWKDASFRASLSESQRSALPQNPAGDADLKAASLASPPAPGTNQPTLTILSTISSWCCG